MDYTFYLVSGKLKINETQQDKGHGLEYARGGYRQPT